MRTLSLSVVVATIVSSGFCIAQPTAEEIVEAVANRWSEVQDVLGSYEGSRLINARSPQQLGATRAALRHAFDQMRENAIDATPAEIDEIDQQFLMRVTAESSISRTTALQGSFLYLSGGRYRIEETTVVTEGEVTNGYSRVAVSDGATLTVERAAEGEVTVRESASAADRYICPLGWLPRLLSGTTFVSYERSESIRGHECHLLQVDLPPELAEGLYLPGCPAVTKVHIWVDAETYVWRQIEEYGTVALLVSDAGLPPRRFSATPESPAALRARHEAPEWLPYADGVLLPSRYVSEYLDGREEGQQTILTFSYIAVNQGATVEALTTPLPATLPWASDSADPCRPRRSCGESFGNANGMLARLFVCGSMRRTLPWPSEPTLSVALHRSLMMN